MTIPRWRVGLIWLSLACASGWCAATADESAQKDGPASVRFAWPDKPGEIRLSVADTGRGIPEADVPHVFDRFYRVDAARSPATGGVGLGLAIVRTIVTLHGGSVALQSAVGKGTRVTLTFPRGSTADGSTGR